MTDDTLDPPGSIAVLGGGPIGIEAALYGRYLGYSVILFEADRLAHSLLAAPDHAPPDVCTSPLGLAAVAAQRGLGGTLAEVRPESYQSWVDDYFDRIAESDLLSGRVRVETAVERLELAPEEDQAEETEQDEVDSDEDDEATPPDFLVHYVTAGGVTGVERCEAVIDARGVGAPWIGPGDHPPEQLPAYLYHLGARAAEDANYREGLKQIRALFATLWGRPGLDIYANLGGNIDE